MENRFDRLGDLLRDRLSSDEDPFEAWDPHGGTRRRAGNVQERTPPPDRAAPKRRVAVPEELIEDFRVLGLLPGESLEDCKTAWRRLLKRHHPDTSAGDPEAEARQSQITRRLTESYRRIASWYETGTL
ncbi:MAG TPA: J domain-containing protein [Treponemataceae bacterium]|nr:J domain-containing protein [Treponemataceae bacterium]HPS44246.1 J domain-containing protein [Treponemataceae bacterium]